MDDHGAGEHGHHRRAREQPGVRGDQGTAVRAGVGHTEKGDGLRFKRLLIAELDRSAETTCRKLREYQQISISGITFPFDHRWT